MRRRVPRFFPVALCLMATSLALQTGLSAQHGGPTASVSSAHMGGPSSSSSGPSRSFAPPSGSFFQSPSLHKPSLRPGQAAHPEHWPTPNRPHHPDDGRNGARYRVRYPYLYGSYPALIPFGYGLPLAYAGLPDGDEQDGSGAQPTPQQADYGEQPVGDYGRQGPVSEYGSQHAANAPPPFRPAYQGQIAAVPVHAQPITTLIFKDGRQPAQVHNYALTGSVLYALDGESRQEIPLSLLDVPATVEVNRAAGVDFAVPVSR
jgi:hypothetical protein